jgi:hypothetical protein
MTSKVRRIEEFHTDLDGADVLDGHARFARAVATVAYLRAFPSFLHLRQLTEYLQGRQVMAPGEEPLGGWFLMRQLADPSVTTVSPNVDTLYGAAHLMLGRQGPVVLELPRIADRYWSIAALDASLRVFSLIGCRTFAEGGGAHLIVPPDWTGEPPEGVGATHRSPTSACLLLQRIYCAGPQDLGIIHELQDSIVVSSLERWQRGERGFDPVDTTDWQLEGVRQITDPIRFFELTGAFTADDPPSPGDVSLDGLLEAAGLDPGGTSPSVPEIRAAIVAGATDAQRTIDADLSDPPTAAGWRLPDRSGGRLDAPIRSRAATQCTQMGLLPLDEASYYFAYTDEAGERLEGSHRYRLTFGPGDLPPHGPLGFWSLTMYGSDSLLVANELERYVIRPDTSGLRFEHDGGLTIHLSASAPDRRDNWLPAPVGPFNVGLRIYLGDSAVGEGTWRPPGIRRVHQE